MVGIGGNGGFNAGCVSFVGQCVFMVCLVCDLFVSYLLFSVGEFVVYFYVYCLFCLLYVVIFAVGFHVTCFAV